MTPDTGILTHLLNAFLTVFNGGWSALQPKAQSLFGILVGIELTLSGLWWAMSGNDAVKSLVQKLLVIGLFFFFIQQWQMLTTTTLQSFARAGAVAGGADNTPGGINGLSDPSTIIDEGFNAMQPLSDKVDALTQGTWTALKNLGTIMQLGLAMIGILLAFFLLGIQCFLVYLEFYIVAVLSLILLPFGVFRHTAFIAEKAFGAVIAHGIKLMVLAFVIAVAQPVLQQITISPDFSLRDAWCTLLASMTICFLAWHAPSMAAGLLAGSPTLSAGQAVGGALEAGGVALLGAAGIAAAGRAVAGGAGATIQAASALKTGADVGAARAAEAGAGPVGQAIGAVAGASKVAAMAPLNALAERMGKRVSDGQMTALASHGLDSSSSPPSGKSSESPKEPNASGPGKDSSTDGNPAPSTSSGSVYPGAPASTSPASSGKESNAPAPAEDSRGASASHSTSAVSATQSATVTQARQGDVPAEVARMSGEAPASPAPQTMEAARTSPGQRRVDDAVSSGLRPNLGASLHRDGSAPEHATDATQYAARAADDSETIPDEQPEPLARVAEPALPPPTPEPPKDPSR